jgi:hypothetical protein
VAAADGTVAAARRGSPSCPALPRWRSCIGPIAIPAAGAPAWPGRLGINGNEAQHVGRGQHSDLLGSPHGVDDGVVFRDPTAMQLQGHHILTRRSAGTTQGRQPGRGNPGHLRPRCGASRRLWPLLAWPVEAPGAQERTAGLDGTGQRQRPAVRRQRRQGRGGYLVAPGSSQYEGPFRPRRADPPPAAAELVGSLAAPLPPPLRSPSPRPPARAQRASSRRPRRARHTSSRPPGHHLPPSCPRASPRRRPRPRPLPREPNPRRGGWGSISEPPEKFTPALAAAPSVRCLGASPLRPEASSAKNSGDVAGRKNCATETTISPHARSSASARRTVFTQAVGVPFSLRSFIALATALPLAERGKRHAYSVGARGNHRRLGARGSSRSTDSSCTTSAVRVHRADAIMLRVSDRFL